MSAVAELFSRLDGDAWRIRHPFSIDMLQANALLHNSAATEEEMADCLALWCQHWQPCQFGRAAAKQGRIHFCLLREEAVSAWSDEEIAEKIGEEKQLWKQRAACDPERAAHSLIIVVASLRVALAPPDQHLRAFSDRILELAGWEADRRGARRRNTITSDFLYLKNPLDGGFYGFRFNVDFFACAGDGRWWHDHRIKALRLERALERGPLAPITPHEAGPRGDPAPQAAIDTGDRMALCQQLTHDTRTDMPCSPDDTDAHPVAPPSTERRFSQTETYSQWRTCPRQGYWYSKAPV
jgi:hypothetical protein